MRPHLVWSVLLVPTTCAIWQTQAQEPFLSPLAIGILLLLVGIIAGLRLATDSATRFVRDLTVLNKYLAEQNRDLAEMNRLLLQKTSTAGEELPLAPRNDET